jgi:spore coat protein CotH
VIRRMVLAVTATVLAVSVLAAPATPRVEAATEGWPEIFDPLVLHTLNLQLAEHDWDTVRRDTTNDIEVPATFWADSETPILVSVRRKSSRALPSESNPIKVGLKVDINEFVDGQTWHGLNKVSLENGADAGVVEEGLAWNMHRFASGPDGYGYEAGFASWVRVNVNGQYIGLYVNAEQRDKQALRLRGLWDGGETWLYDQGERGDLELEEGDPDSPAVTHLCYSPFRPKAKGSCSTPPDSELEADLQAWLNMDGFLSQCAVDALTDNTDALCSHGKNAFFVDFTEARMATGLRRMYLPWDLDAVFGEATSNIYGLRSGRRLVQQPYESVILNDKVFRAQYNAKVLGLTEPETGPLSEAALHTFLDQLQPVLAQAIAQDPYPPNKGVGGNLGNLRTWLTQRIASARSQAIANTNPAPRP